MTWIPQTNLDPALQDWSEAYKELCDLIAAKLPQVKHVDLYYGQEAAVDGDGNWLPFRAPAVFLEFNAAEVMDLGEMSQQLTLDITAYLYVETVQDTNAGSLGQRRALEFTGLMRQLHQVLHGAHGEHFGTLTRTAMRRVEAPPYAYFYAQTYRCTLIDNSTAPQWSYVDLTNLGVEKREP